jgi:DNA-binding NarL/FixJ family response regulator
MDLGRPDRTSVGAEERRTLAVAAVFATIAALAALDLASDLGEGIALRHALIELGIVLVCAVGLGVLLRRVAALRRREQEARVTAASLARDLQASQAEAARWREEARDLVAGLGTLIDRQLARWELSAAEKEVALLLLKGLSHKEIAASRSVSEATVRQQAAAIYRKAGIAGRHDLAAFFLEDLLVPRQPPA